MSISVYNNERAQKLYAKEVSKAKLDPDRFAAIVVQHVLPNTVPLFKALRVGFKILGIVPKEKSTNPATLDQLRSLEPPFDIEDSTRSQLRDPAYLKRVFGDKLGSRSLIIFDIGGYFAESINALVEVFGDKIIGIVEDTQNGHAKYEVGLKRLADQGIEVKFPILSVARSPLKEPEDFLVGQSVLYSTENLLRAHNTLLTNKKALVIGYGKIGKSIANSLAVRNVTVWVHDHDPIRSAQALSHGFAVPNRDDCIAKADIIVGATGNKSLVENDFYRLNHHSFVCSVTSADDEFDFGGLYQNLSSQDTKRFARVFRQADGRTFHLLNDGNAVNFLHGAELGPYIYLVGCELIACAVKIAKDSSAIARGTVGSLREDERALLAEAWLGEFNDDR